MPAPHCRNGSCRYVRARPSHLFWQKGLEWPCPVRSALKKTPVQDFSSFSIIFYYIISTTYQKIGDLFCPVHIFRLFKNFIQIFEKIKTFELKMLLNLQNHVFLLLVLCMQAHFLMSLFEISHRKFARLRILSNHNGGNSF